MLQLQPIDTRGVGYFDIIVVVVVIEFIHDPDTERVRVTEAAIIYSCYVEMLSECKITLSFQDSIQFNQPIANELPFSHIVTYRFPECVLPCFVFKRYRICVVQ